MINVVKEIKFETEESEYVEVNWWVHELPAGFAFCISAPTTLSKREVAEMIKENYGEDQFRHFEWAKLKVRSSNLKPSGRTIIKHFVQKISEVPPTGETNPNAIESRWQSALDRQCIHSSWPTNLMVRADESRKLIGGGLYPCPHCGRNDLVIKHPITGALHSDCRCEYGTPGPAKSSILGEVILLKESIRLMEG